jgi:hypothetical protein
LNRPQKAVLALVLLSLALMALLHSWGYGPLVVLGVAVAGVLVIYVVPRLVIRAAEGVHEGLHHQTWKHEEGRHHNFAGITVAVQDDGRHVWMDGESLKRLLARREADDVLAARISGKWRHDERQRLWLRVDGVIEHLSVFPGRMDPRVQRLRRWLERDVLFPAARRHAAGRRSGR